jgi:hypothetical protein
MLLLKAKKEMKILRWPATLAVLLLFAAASFADDIPPDGNTSVRGGGDPIQITEQNQSIAFSGCVPDVPGCTATFSGVNATGTPWNFLALTLDWSPPDTSDGGFSIGCNGGTLFLATGGSCGSTIPDTITSTTVDFFQAGGTGIGCYDNGTPGNNGPPPAPPASIPTYAANCLFNYGVGGLTPPFSPTNCSPGVVCGPDAFTITLTDFQDTPLMGSIAYNPEPATFTLVGGAMLGMLLLCFKKTAESIG